MKKYFAAVLIFNFVFLIFNSALAQVTFQKLYGGSGNNSYDMGQHVIGTFDHGSAIAGFASSGTYDNSYLVKTDSAGNISWTKTYGYNSGTVRALDIAQTPDSGFILTGFILGTGSGPMFLLKTNKDGDTLWTKTFGGGNIEEGISVIQTNDGGYIAVGYTESFLQGPMQEAFYVIKTDGNGDTLWTRAYGEPVANYAFSVVQTSDSGYIIIGETLGSVYEILLVKINSSGNLLWSKRIGNSVDATAFDIKQTFERGYVAVGVTGNSPQRDILLLKMDSVGSIIWTKAYAESTDDFAYTLDQTPYMFETRS